MRIRAEYRVGPDLKFLANLDMMHLMERALRRAEIPYALSEGFNPHIRLSMGTVLPVGLWGESEYFDLHMSRCVPVEEFISRMNHTLPTGMQIKQCREINPGTPALMKVINAAEYAFLIKKDHLRLDRIVSEVLQQKSIPIPSRGKNKAILKDLRPGIHKLTAVDEEEANYLLTAMVSVNEPLNIRYDELMDLWANYGIEKANILDYWRRGNYIKTGDDFYLP